jgi:hypothetical protein
MGLVVFDPPPVGNDVLCLFSGTGSGEQWPGRAFTWAAFGQASGRWSTSLSGFCTRACLSRIAPATCANDAPLQTANEPLGSGGVWTKPHAADPIVAHADGFGACHTATSAGGCAPLGGPGRWRGAADGRRPPHRDAEAAQGRVGPRSPAGTGPACAAGQRVHDSRRGVASSSIQAMGVGAYPHEEGGAMPWSPMRRTYGWRRR